MGSTYLVTRHPGAREWVRRQGMTARSVVDADACFMDRLRPGDTVIGTLPAPLVAAVTATGATYRHLSLDLSPDLRGRELSADEMEAAGARLVTVRAWCPDAPAAPPPPPSAPPDPLPFRDFWRFLPGFTVLVAGAWLLDVALDGVKIFLTAPDGPARRHGAGLAVAGFGLAAVAGHALWKRRGRLMAFSIRHSRHILPKKAVILGLSSIVPPRTAEDICTALKQGDLEDALAKVARTDPRSAWQQPLRALACHRPALRLAVVIGSPGAEGSHRHIGAFAEAVAHLMPGITVLPAPGPAPDFGDHDALRRVFLDAIGLARRELDLDDGDIAVDATPGTKIFSIAAAAATINRDMTFTYIGNDGHPHVYDAAAALGE